MQLGSFCSRILGSWEGNIETDELWINSEIILYWKKKKRQQQQQQQQQREKNENKEKL